MIKKILKWIGIVFVVFIVGIGVFAFLGLNETKNLKIENIDLSKIKDGSYEGTYNSYRWTNTVNVTVKDHKIESIFVLKTVMSDSSDFAVEVFDKVIEKQGLDVDTVGGATANTKAYLKSIENALNK